VRHRNEFENVSDNAISKIFLCRKISGKFSQRTGFFLKVFPRQNNFPKTFHKTFPKKIRTGHTKIWAP